MYQNVDEVLRSVYRIAGVRIEPLNNTAKICMWIENKGVLPIKQTGLTQHDYHANAAMIIKQMNRVLNRYELAVIEGIYGGLLHGIVDITTFIEEQNKGVNLLICDALIAHILIDKPKRTEIMDKYDISNGKFYREKRKIEKIIDLLLNSAVCKLEILFQERGIIK